LPSFFAQKSKLIGDFFSKIGNARRTDQWASPFYSLVSSDCNDRKIFRTDGKLERPERRNDRKAGITGKPNDREPDRRKVIEKEPVSAGEKNQEKELILPVETYVRNRFNNRPRDGFELENGTNLTNGTAT
jgi:hypothetical protein